MRFCVRWLHWAFLVLILQSKVFSCAQTDGLLERESNNCSGRCDAKSRKFIIILGVGRSGSTTILDMVNGLPSVELSGEHDGLLLSFYDMKTHLEETKKRRGGRARPTGAWTHKVADNNIEDLYCLMQEWLVLHSGNTYGPDTIHGFKEIRYTTPEILEFIADAFPSAQFVINYRKVLEDISDDLFLRDPLQVGRLTSNLKAFADRHEDRTFLAPLEDFSEKMFTELSMWLGFSNCRAISVAHSNEDGYGGNDTRSNWLCASS